MLNFDDASSPVTGSSHAGDLSPSAVPLCNSADLVGGGLAVPFDINYAGQTMRAFAVRYQGVAAAYLNRCTHVAMELDWQPNKVFDPSGRWLTCATHGAVYEPATGGCAGGPCKDKLVAVPLIERHNVVYWLAEHPFKEVVF